MHQLKELVISGNLMLFKFTSSILYREQASILKEASNNFYSEILAQHLPQEHVSHFCTL